MIRVLPWQHCISLSIPVVFTIISHFDRCYNILCMLVLQSLHRRIGPKASCLDLGHLDRQGYQYVHVCVIAIE